MGFLAICEIGDKRYKFLTSDGQKQSDPFVAHVKADFMRELEIFRKSLHPADRTIPLDELSERFMQSW